MRVISAVAVLVFLFSFCALIGQAETLKGVDISHSTLGPLTPPKNSDEAEKKKKVALDALESVQDVVSGFSISAKFVTHHSKDYASTLLPDRKTSIFGKDRIEHCKLTYKNGKYRFDYREYFAGEKPPVDRMVSVFDGQVCYAYFPLHDAGSITKKLPDIVISKIDLLVGVYMGLPLHDGFFQSALARKSAQYLGEQSVDGEMCQKIKLVENKDRSSDFYINGNRIIRVEFIHRDYKDTKLNLVDIHEFSKNGFPIKGRRVHGDQDPGKPWAMVTDWEVVSYSPEVAAGSFSPLKFPVDTFVTDSSGDNVKSYYVGGLKKHE